MDTKTAKIGKKGGAKRIANKLKEIRQHPISKDIFQIVDDYVKEENEPKPLKKIARPKLLEQ